MSLLHHVQLCNGYDPDRFLPFRHGADRLGLIRKDNAAALRALADLDRLIEDARILSKLTR